MNTRRSVFFFAIVLGTSFFLPLGLHAQTDYRMKGGGPPPLRFELVYFSRFLVHPGVGVGVDPFKDKVHQFSPFFKMMTFGQYPYNGYMLPHFGWILGVSYHFEGKRRQS